MRKRFGRRKPPTNTSRVQPSRRKDAQHASDLADMHIGVGKTLDAGLGVSRQAGDKGIEAALLQLPRRQRSERPLPATIPIRGAAAERRTLRNRSRSRAGLRLQAPPAHYGLASRHAEGPVRFRPHECDDALDRGLVWKHLVDVVEPFLQRSFLGEQ